MDAAADHRCRLVPTEMSDDVQVLCVDMSGTGSELDDFSKMQSAGKSVQLEAAARIIKKLSKEELENLFLEQMCFVLRQRGTASALEKKLQSSSAHLSQCRRRTQQLHKQVDDLTAVIKRYIGQAQGVVLPARITRGVQVDLTTPPAQWQHVANVTPVADRLPVKSSVIVYPPRRDSPPQRKPGNPSAEFETSRTKGKLSSPPPLKPIGPMIQHQRRILEASSLSIPGSSLIGSAPPTSGFPADPPPAVRVSNELVRERSASNSPKNEKIVSSDRSLHPLESVVPDRKPPPPRPVCHVSRVSDGIKLSWTIQDAKNHADVASYQLFAYQEESSPSTWTSWTKIGVVKALQLPMACTLTQFQDGHHYHFAVRAIDVHGRTGPYSEPRGINRRL